MYIGAYQQGDEVWFRHRQWLADPGYSNIPFGSSHPQFACYRLSSPIARVDDATDRVMAACDYAIETGLFSGSVFLDSRFTAGRYAIRVRSVANISGFPVITEYYHFEVIPGGDALGTITAMKEIERPDVRLLVAGTTSGNILRRKNPRIIT